MSVIATIWMWQNRLTSLITDTSCICLITDTICILKQFFECTKKQWSVLAIPWSWKLSWIHWRRIHRRAQSPMQRWTWKRREARRGTGSLSPSYKATKKRVACTINTIGGKGSSTHIKSWSGSHYYRHIKEWPNVRKLNHILKLFLLNLMVILSLNY